MQEGIAIIWFTVLNQIQRARLQPMICLANSMADQASGKIIDSAQTGRLSDP